MTGKLPSVSRRQKSRRTTPKLTLLLNQQKQLQRSPQQGQKKKKRIQLVLFLAIVVVLQVILLRSVSIENQIHDEKISSSGTLQQTSLKKSRSLAEHQASRKPVAENRPLQPSSTPEFSLLYSNPPRLSEFPSWIQEYVAWHRQVRQEFPGMQLFDNPKAPHLLIRTCLGLCGGLHDRIGQLPWDLYLAHKTKRVLLIAWQRPRSLENFLMPFDNLLDWTVPEEAKFGFADIRRVRNETQMFEGFPEANPTDEFFAKDFDIALERATTGIFANIHVLRHRLLGHLYQGELEQRLQNEMPDPKSLHVAPLFGKIFWLFFRPSPPVHEKFISVMKALGISPQTYTAVHCRVRHPKAFSYGATVLGKNPNYPADKTGLPWEGETRQAALGVAFKALQCAKSISLNDHSDTKSNTTSVYFLSDSNDLVSHIAHELPAIDSSANTKAYNWTLPELQQLVSKNAKDGLEILARDTKEENAHIDRQKGRPPEAYYDTFVDLLLVMHARCVVYGIGYYAAFGAKISGTSCQYVYQKEAWKAQVVKEGEICPDGS